MSENRNKLSKKDVAKAGAKYMLAAEVSSGFERLTAPSFSYGISGILEKLYGNDEEEYRSALLRHLMFYNTEAIWGQLIMGVAIALEEERSSMLNSKSSIEEEVSGTADVVTGLKMGLMGPLAGIGDTINHAMIRPLLLSAFIPLAVQGSWLAGVLPFLIWVIGMSALGYILLRLGYNSGRKSIVQLLESGKINKFIDAASVLGLIMMGALSSTYVNLTTSISWVDSATGDAVLLQTYLDNIFPELLPLIVIFAIYFFFKKSGPKYVSVLVIIIVSSLVLAYLGVV